MISYDVVREGRFVGRMHGVVIDIGQHWVRFPLQRYFDYSYYDESPTRSIYYEDIIELEMQDIWFKNDAYVKFFDATHIPMDTLCRVTNFEKAYS